MRRVALVLLGCLAIARATFALEPEERGSIATLPPMGDHCVWVPDRLLQHSLLFDGDTGRVLGMLDAGVAVTPKPPLLSRDRGEIYSVDIIYSRGKRGSRLDVVSIYEAKTLKAIGEILLPTKTGESNTSLAYTALLDGGRFLLVFNQLPITSASVIDLQARRFVGEIPLSGCAGVYPAGERRFATLCGDGSVEQVDLDEAGHGAARTQSDRFFDAVKDPVMMSAARNGAAWIFVSFGGKVREVDFSGNAPRVGPSWSLIGEADRKAKWRVGGLQLVALHRASGRLFTIVHRGGAGSHKDPGPEIWVYDLASRARVDRFKVPNLAGAFLGPALGVEPGGFLDRLFKLVVPNQGAHTIAVTQDERPLLFVRNADVGVVGVLDARTGKHLRTLGEAGFSGPTLEVP